MSFGDALVVGLLLGGVGYAYRRHQSERKTDEQIYKVTRSAGEAATGIAPLISAGLDGLLSSFRSGTGTASPAFSGEGLELPGEQSTLPALTFPGGRIAPGSDWSPSSPTPARSSAQSANIGERLTRDLMNDFGFTRDQAAGFVGNLHHESAGFASLQEITPMRRNEDGSFSPSNTARGGYGYAQWTGPRRLEFEQWAFERGLDYDSYEANYGFLRHELQNTSERRVVARLRAAGSVEQAAEVVMDTFLRPGIEHLSSRVAAARRYA